MQVTNEARKRSSPAMDTATQKAQDAKDYAQQTVDAGSDYVKEGQAQGESAWQKVKATVSDTVDKVTSHLIPSASCTCALQDCLPVPSHRCERQKVHNGLDVGPTPWCRCRCRLRP